MAETKVNDELRKETCNRGSSNARIRQEPENHSGTKVVVVAEGSKGLPVSDVTMIRKPVSQFYRRALPSCNGNVIPFSSSEGRRLFARAMTSGYVNSFFPLIEQFRTQDEPTYCGISTLTMILNALNIDPGRLWKGPWRWYSEEMLDCCKSLDEIKLHGLTFSEWKQLAKCNGVKIEARYASESNIEEFRRTVMQITADSEDSKVAGQENRKFIVVSYTRKGLQQSGSGHFSPLGAYDPEGDMVLVLDVARFKYPPHWVKLPILFNAMVPKDPDSGMSRGYSIVENGNFQSLILFRMQGKQHSMRKLLTKLTAFSRKLTRNVNDREASVLEDDTVKKLVNLCIESCSGDEQDSPLTTILSQFSASHERSTKPFQKWHIEVVPREHIQAMTTLVKEIEETSLFKLIHSILKKKQACSHCLDVQLSNDKSTRYSVNRAHLLTVFFLGVIPKSCSNLAKALGSYLSVKSLGDSLKKEVLALGDSWKQLCDEDVSIKCDSKHCAAFDNICGGKNSC
eukprot:CAMPEP_0114516504 /NCGR_PEP_ID=MMETSP0109-20121206/17364_1 /TAXON_ID=29199 /ORGANISM="Chlorarachnion reptans, Strain CCCM449" /LENGTH=511 /DNA_ID=CAMNT_0001696899 /DNA_START=47 /DNA_END=1582 /DNA_ORIENTATION=+